MSCVYPKPNTEAAFEEACLFIVFYFPSRHRISVESFYFMSKLLGIASFYFVCVDTCLKSLLQFWAIAFSMVAAAVGLPSWKCP